MTLQEATLDIPSTTLPPAFCQAPGTVMDRLCLSRLRRRYSEQKLDANRRAERDAWIVWSDAIDAWEAADTEASRTAVSDQYVSDIATIQAALDLAHSNIDAAYLDAVRNTCCRPVEDAA